MDERLLFTCALAVLQYLSSCGEGAAVDAQGRCKKPCVSRAGGGERRVKVGGIRRCYSTFQAVVKGRQGRCEEACVQFSMGSRDTGRDREG